MSRLPMLAAVLCLTALPVIPVRAADGISIQFMASDGNWADKSFTGHAFVCVQLQVGSGLKEDCYGFYPRKSGKGLVGGAGVVDSEFDFEKHPPTRFSNIKVSATKSITIDERVKVLTFIKGFDKNFTLGMIDCVNFSNGVAKAAGLKVPASTTFTTPVKYVEELRKLNPGT
jgi:hypothetical protein